ncbi:hypothetical protein ACN267_32200 [Micromonospora sp. WMMD734]|uniref:hypothetical protein n=1 Tax=Micromonospora sp. WMMD734 TaxID=3404129 RepID=UPI003B92B548
MSSLPDPRRVAFDLAAAGVATGLPVPARVEVGDVTCNHGDLTLHFGDDRQADADRWAAWLNMPRPVLAGHGPIESAHRWFKPYRTTTRDHEVTRQRVTVQTYVTVPAPADVEAVAR